MTEIDVDSQNPGKCFKTIIESAKDVSSPFPLSGQIVKVHYTGRTTSDNKVFDSSVDRGEPFQFTLGKGEVIKGWDVGVASMRVGEKSHLRIHAEHGYGKQGCGSKIPANSELLFEVELLESNDKPRDISDMPRDERLALAMERKKHANSIMADDLVASSNSYDEAVRYIQDWDEKDDEERDTLFVAIRLNQSLVAFKQNDFSVAEKHALAAYNCRPSNPKTVCRLVAAMIELNKYDGAKSRLSRAISMHPNNADLRSLFVVCKEKSALTAKKRVKIFSSMLGKPGIYSDKPCIEPLPVINIGDCKKCYMKVRIGDGDVYTVVFALYTEYLPKTSDNFRKLCIGWSDDSQNTWKYQGSIFHRLISGFMIQGGDLVNGDGTGSVSIYGDKFKDEGFMFSHNRRGLLSMANSGPNTNGSQFFITLDKCTHLDDKHVVFGEVVEGVEFMDTLKEIGTDDQDKPTVTGGIQIIECGDM